MRGKEYFQIKKRVKIFLKEQNHLKHNHDNLVPELSYVYTFLFRSLNFSSAVRILLRANFIIEKYEVIAEISCQIF